VGNIPPMRNLKSQKENASTLPGAGAFTPLTYLGLVAQRRCFTGT
jgi:hypothetical protein